MEQEMEQVRKAALSYLTEAKPLNWEIHHEELSEAVVVIVEDVNTLGLWGYDPAEKVLLRDAEIAAEVRRYGMRFEQGDDGAFRVVDDFWEKESFTFEESE